MSKGKRVAIMACVWVAVIGGFVVVLEWAKSQEVQGAGMVALAWGMSAVGACVLMAAGALVEEAARHGKQQSND